MVIQRPGELATLLPALGVAALVVLALHFGAHTPPSAPAGPVVWSSAINATNGIVTTQLSKVGPTVGVAGASAPIGSGLFAGLQGLEEVGAKGEVLSVANLSAAGWLLNNQSAPARMLMIYSASVEVVRSTGVAIPTPANITVAFSDVGGAGAPAAQTSAVTMAIGVQDWPWLHPTDALALLMPLAPRTPSEEYLTAGGLGTMECADASSHAPREYFAWAPTATGIDPSGDSVPVTPAEAVTGGPANVTVEALVPGEYPAFINVEFTTTVGVVLPPPAEAVAPAVTELVLIGVSALGLGALWVARWTWGRPPSMREAEPTGE